MIATAAAQRSSPVNCRSIIGDPTVADAILDRLVHNAHRLILKGDSLRKTAAKTSGLDGAEQA